MTQFKVGDRVRADDGDEGTVTRIEGEVIWAEFEKAGNAYDNSYALTLVGEISSFEHSVRRHTDRIANLLIEKNKAYGDSALNPVRVFSKADRTEQLYTRIDDKISRIQKGTDFANEDTIDDLIGYLFLLKIAKESA